MDGLYSRHCACVANIYMSLSWKLGLGLGRGSHRCWCWLHLTAAVPDPVCAAARRPSCRRLPRQSRKVRRGTGHAGLTLSGLQWLVGLAPYARTLMLSQEAGADPCLVPHATTHPPTHTRAHTRTHTHHTHTHTCLCATFSLCSLTHNVFLVLFNTHTHTSADLPTPHSHHLTPPAPAPNAPHAGEADAAAHWHPSRDPALGPHPRDPVRPLFGQCLDVLTAYIDCVESLWGVPDAIKVCVCDVSI